MQQRGHRNPNAGKEGEAVLVTDTAFVAEPENTEAMRPREGDVLRGLRVGLAISAAMWAGIVFLGLIIFG